MRREGIGEMGRVHLRRKEEKRVIGLVSIQPPPSSGDTFGSREKKRNSGRNLLFFSELGFAPLLEEINHPKDARGTDNLV